MDIFVYDLVLQRKTLGIYHYNRRSQPDHISDISISNSRFMIYLYRFTFPHHHHQKCIYIHIQIYVCLSPDDPLYRCFAPCVINDLLPQWVHPSILYLCTLGQFFCSSNKRENFNNLAVVSRYKICLKKSAILIILGRECFHWVCQ